MKLTAKRACVRLPRAAAAFGALILAISAHAAPPPRVTLDYEISHNGAVMVEGKETLEHDGKTYRINSEGRGKGLYALAGSITRTSQGAVAADGLKAAEFRDLRGSDLSVAKLDWSAKTLTQERHGKTETQPLPEHAYDRLNFLWSFAFVPPPSKGKIVEAAVVDGRGAPAQYRYAIAGTEILKTGAGDIEALHLVKQRDAGDERRTEIWLAARRNYLPVRILVIEKDGTRIDQVVTRIAP